MRRRSTAPSIELASGAEANGFATMLADLLRQNVGGRPEKRRAFQRLVGRVALVIEDADVAVTLVFRAGALVVHGGIVGLPDVTIRAPSDDITRMSLMELLPRVGWPDPRGVHTRAILRASKEGRIHVHGALAHLQLVLRLTEVMSVT